MLIIPLLVIRMKIILEVSNKNNSNYNNNDNNIYTNNNDNNANNSFISI